MSQGNLFPPPSTTVIDVGAARSCAEAKHIAKARLDGKGLTFARIEWVDRGKRLNYTMRFDGFNDVTETIERTKRSERDLSSILANINITLDDLR